MWSDKACLQRLQFRCSKDLLLESSVTRTVFKSSYSKKRAQLHEGSLTRKWRKVFLVLELKYQRYQNFILKFARAKNSAFAIRNYRSKQEDYQYHSKNIWRPAIKISLCCIKKALKATIIKLTVFTNANVEWKTENFILRVSELSSNWTNFFEQLIEIFHRVTELSSKWTFE